MSLGIIESNDARSLIVKPKPERPHSNNQSAHALACTGLTKSKTMRNIETFRNIYPGFDIVCIHSIYVGIYLADEVA